MTNTVSFFACFLSGDFGGCCAGVVSVVSGDCGLVERLVDGLLWYGVGVGQGLDSGRNCICHNFSTLFG